MNNWIVPFLSVCTLLAAPVARAEDPGTKERAARKACLSGNVTEGVAILSDLFIDTRNTTHIFNQGRCFEQNNRYEEALGRFREYLRASKKLSDEDRANAELHIADCQAMLANPGGTPAKLESKEPIPAATTPGPGGQPVLGLPSAPVAPPAEASIQQSSNAPIEGPRAGLRIAGVTVAAVGAAALVAGVALNLKANDLASDITAPKTFLRATESRRAAYETASWVSYGVGAAALVGGTVLYLVGRSSPQGASSSVALAPAFSSSGIGAVLTGAY